MGYEVVDSGSENLVRNSEMRLLRHGAAFSNMRIKFRLECLDRHSSCKSGVG